MSRSMGTDYFERLYAQNDDPWNFATSNYEDAKYTDTVKHLGNRRFRHGLEVGCSIGVLTARLAPFCGRLSACDVSESALARARIRCAPFLNVDFFLSNLPNKAPAGTFDLIVLSEVCYYWSATDLAHAKDALFCVCETGARIILVHWTPYVESYPQTGDAVHETFLEDTRFVRIDGHRADQYRLDVLDVQR